MPSMLPAALTTIIWFWHAGEKLLLARYALVRYCLAPLLFLWYFEATMALLSFFILAFWLFNFDPTGSGILLDGANDEELIGLGFLRSLARFNLLKYSRASCLSISISWLPSAELLKTNIAWPPLPARRPAPRNPSWDFKFLLLS